MASRRGSLKVWLMMLVMIFTSVVVGASVSAQTTSATPREALVDSRRAPSAPAQDVEAGKATYAASCASCHQPGGTGVEGTFPPLAGNANVADAAYVETVIQDGKRGPIEVNGVPYDSVMPAVPGLSDAEVADLAAYVASLAEGGAVAPTEPTEVVEAGSISEGKALFDGSAGLANGGGTCSGCHIAGSVGNLGGTGLGPDLTDVAERLGGEAGLSAWLINPPSATMTPIFAERALTADEIADLTAFMVDAPNQDAPSRAFDWMFLAGAIGTMVLLGGMAIAYRGMRQTYVERLKAKTKARAGGPTARGRA